MSNQPKRPTEKAKISIIYSESLEKSAESSHLAFYLASLLADSGKLKYLSMMLDIYY